MGLSGHLTCWRSPTSRGPLSQDLAVLDLRAQPVRCHPNRGDTARPRSLGRRTRQTIAVRQAAPFHSPHNPEADQSGAPGRQRQEPATGRSSRLAFNMIIVSEPSAEATRRVRTERCAPARSRSSAVHNNTPGYADARPISVHTEECAGAIPNHPPTQHARPVLILSQRVRGSKHRLEPARRARL